MGNDEKNKDSDEVQQDYQALSEAFEEFACKLEIYDPLGRDIFNEDGDNEALSREELLDEIRKLQPIVGSSLNVPLSEDMLEDLNNLISLAENQVISLAEDYIHRGWNEGKSFDNTFLLEDKVKVLTDALNVFADHDLLKDSRIRREKAINFINEADQRINEAKEFHLMNDTEVRISNMLSELFIVYNKRDFEDLAKKMIEIQ